jgi:hypothetical protein
MIKKVLPLLDKNGSLPTTPRGTIELHFIWQNHATTRARHGERREHILFNGGYTRRSTEMDMIVSQPPCV